MLNDNMGLSDTDSTPLLSSHNVVSRPSSSIWKVLLLWQLCAILSTVGAICAQNIANHGIDAPSCQSFLIYLLLAMFFGVKCTFFPGGDHVEVMDEQRALSLKRTFGVLFNSESRQWNWIAYLLVALVDTEAIVVIVLAYQYTNLVSVQLLDCAAIPACMVLALLLNQSARFSGFNYLGSAVALLGMGGLVWSDYRFGSGNENQFQSMDQAWKGDLLVLLGAILYALSNTGQEIIAKNGNSNLLLFRMGIFGSIISGLQALVNGNARNIFLALHDNDALLEICLSFSGFGISMFCASAIIPRLLSESSATVMNLSYLASDFWSLLAAAFLFGISFNWVYLMMFAVIVGGIIIYHLRELMHKQNL
jgi:solute carrier family 35 protein F1/2